MLLVVAYEGCVRRRTVVAGIARRSTSVCVEEWKERAEVPKDLEVLCPRCPR